LAHQNPDQNFYSQSSERLPVDPTFAGRKYGMAGLYEGVRKHAIQILTSDSASVFTFEGRKIKLPPTP
jgi:hypothetical protein